MKYETAIAVLLKELIKLGGQVFAGKMAMNNEAMNTTFKATEFMEDLFKGKVNKKDSHSLKRYLEPMWEINNAIIELQKIK
jgi:hypothetical protein